MAGGKPARGGQGGYEPRARIAARQARAWELSLAGWTQRAIAQDLGVSQAAVAKILKRTADTLSQALRRETAAHTARLAAQVDHLYSEMMAAWERSKVDQTRRRHRRVDHECDGTTSSGTTTVVEAIVTAREGDPRFAGLALRALTEKHALLERIGDAHRAGSLPDSSADSHAEKLSALSTADLVTLRTMKVKLALNWSEGAADLFRVLTPEELIFLANIKKRERGDSDVD
jgi:predicted transcriptional regulator